MSSGDGFRRLVDALTSHGVAVKGSHIEQDVKCPAHEDRRASLSIGHGQKGALVHCQAGCPTESVLAAVNLKASALFDDKNEPKSGIAEVFGYVDEGGVELYQSVRLEPKDFRQRRPDDKGGWIWNMQGVRRVLYRLPEVAAAVAEGRWIAVVEGEKDADRLHKEGIVATTNPMGAGKWTTCDSAILSGANVAIVPDNDKSGREHAHAVATDLAGRAAVVKVINLDDVPDKGDISTWLNNGGSAEQLRDVIINADEWEPTQPPPGINESGKTEAMGPWTPVDLAAVAAAGLDPIEPDVLWRRDGRALLYSGKLNVIFAAPEAGKTWIAIIAIAELVRNATNHGLGIVAAVIDYEDNARSYLTRLRDAGIPPEQAAIHTRYYSMAQAIRTAPDDLEGLSDARLVVIDTTNSAMTLDDLDPLSNADALSFINHVRRLRADHQAAWLLLDHEPISTGAGRRQAIGAQSKLGAVDGAQYRAVAVQQPRPGGEGAISLHVTKDRAGGVRQWAAPPDEHGIQHAATVFLNPRTTSRSAGAFDYAIIEPQGAEGDAELRSAILSVCDDWVSKGQVKALVRDRGIKRRNDVITETTEALSAEGLLDGKPKGNYVVYKTPEQRPTTHPGTGDTPPPPTHPRPRDDHTAGPSGNVDAATNTDHPGQVGTTGDELPVPRPHPLVGTEGRQSGQRKKKTTTLCASCDTPYTNAAQRTGCACDTDPY